MSEITKQICPGFYLRIHKRLLEYTIDFSLDNRTEFIYLFHFLIKDQVNVRSADDELEKYVKVLPNTCFSFMQLIIEGSFNYKYEFKYQKLKPEPVVKQVEITQDLVLYINQQDTEQKIVFELQNKSDSSVHFELTILELSGIRSLSGKTLFIVDVQPGDQSEVCELNFDGAWSYKYSYTYSFRGFLIWKLKKRIWKIDFGIGFDMKIRVLWE